MMSFLQSGIETSIYRNFSDNKLDGMYVGQLSQHNFLTSFDDDAENDLLTFLMISSTYIYMATQNGTQNTASLQN